jgi:hypothetical protein
MMGKVHSVASDAGGVVLGLTTPHGPTEVHVPRSPSIEGASRVDHTLRRCLSVCLEQDAKSTWHSTVRGIGHRNPIDLPISVATALGLLVRGLPGVVRLP